MHTLVKVVSFAVCLGGLVTVVPAQDGVRSLAAAAAFLAKQEERFVAGIDGRGFRLSPDGQRLAWLAVADGKPMSASTDSRPLDLMLGDATGREPRAVRLAEAKWPDYAAFGPHWTADGKRVLVGYRVVDEDYRTTSCIDAVGLDGEVVPLVRRENETIVGLAVAPRGDWFGATFSTYHSDTRTETQSFLLYDGKGDLRREQALGDAGGVAAFSPNASQLAFVSDHALFVGDVAAGAPDALDIVPTDATIAAAPQWLADGKRFVVAAGGGVALAEVGAGVRRHWRERELGGRAHAVVVLPGDAIAAAVVEREVDGNVVEVLLGAGHAPKRTFADLVLLDLATGVLQRSKVKVRVLERGHYALPYLPRISELLAKYGR